MCNLCGCNSYLELVFSFYFSCCHHCLNYKECYIFICSHWWCSWTASWAKCSGPWANFGKFFISQGTVCSFHLSLYIDIQWWYVLLQVVVNVFCFGWWSFMHNYSNDDLSHMYHMTSYTKFLSLYFFFSFGFKLFHIGNPHAILIYNIESSLYSTCHISSFNLFLGLHNLNVATINSFLSWQFVLVPCFFPDMLLTQKRRRPFDVFSRYMVLSWKIGN